MSIKFISKSNLKNQTVLLRASLDAPLDEKTGKVGDDFRLHSLLSTVKFLVSSGNKVIICGKNGRPKGKNSKSLSLLPVAEHLSALLKMKMVHAENEVSEYGLPHLVFFSGDIREKKNIEIVKNIPKKDVVVLENMEFYQEELDNDKKFAKQLSELADIYVNDDFSKCHHEVASNSAVAEILPSYAGLLLEKEIKSLDKIIKAVKKPFVLMTGGIKLTEKVGVLENLGKKADTILVGGGVANLLFKQKGFEIGLSRIEEGQEKTAFRVLKNYKEKLVLPLDVVVADKDLNSASVRVCSPYEVGKKEVILDAGPKTILEFSKYIKSAKTIVWSGPLGMFEKKPFYHATFALCRLIGGRGKGFAFAVAGGGDTVDAIRQSHQFEHFDHISTGGGAMLEYLAGKKLPGLEILK